MIQLWSLWESFYHSEALKSPTTEFVSLWFDSMQGIIIQNSIWLESDLIFEFKETPTEFAGGGKLLKLLRLG